jgi:hypothetical protein
MVCTTNNMAQTAITSIRPAACQIQAPTSHSRRHRAQNRLVCRAIDGSNGFPHKAVQADIACRRLAELSRTVTRATGPVPSGTVAGVMVTGYRGASSSTSGWPRR